MKIAEMRGKTGKELAKHADKLRGKLAEARTDRFIGEAKNISQFRALKKELAQTLTVLSEQSINASGEEN
jgi:ribosomal protein L29